jgi:phosphopantetheinyl transferase (holo-ACP synthase)
MATYLKSRGVRRSHLSLTDDAGVAMAFVVLEG